MLKYSGRDKPESIGLTQSETAVKFTSNRPTDHQRIKISFALQCTIRNSKVSFICQNRQASVKTLFQ